MTIVLLGASGSGKSTIENEFSKRGYRKIISYTTRKPRPGEEDGKDYYFVTNEVFERMLVDGLFAEYEEYSHGRYYGTLKSSYEKDKDKVVVLTPNGLRQLKRNIGEDDFCSVLVEASLATRMKRYIDRCGESFNFDDKNEICARVERDFGAFMGVEYEVDYIAKNDGADVNDVVDAILEKING